jgi:transposase
LIAAEGGRAMLVELSVMEQRYHAVMEAVSGAPVTEVARRYGVSRQAVHSWLGKYRKGGLAGLADHSHRPHYQPRQLEAGIEAMICQLRSAHPRWGPRRLQYELGRAGVAPVPSRSTVYRALARRGLVPARKRKRRRQDCKRWQREAPMQLWQMDITGSVFLTDGTELKLISGIDDHSRFCVIATVIHRATGRAVCRAFIAAMRTYGIPGEVLADNGKQFTGRFGKPRPAEVLFERIRRRNGIRQRLTKPYSPTPPPGRSNAGTRPFRKNCWMTPAPSPPWRKPGPRSMTGGRNTTTGGRTSPWTWPALLTDSGPHPAMTWRCGLLATSSPSPQRCQARPRRRSWPACDLAGRHRDRTGRPRLGEHDGRAAAVLAGHQPDRPDGQVLDRHHHRAPEH